MEYGNNGERNEALPDEVNKILNLNQTRPYLKDTMNNLL